MPSKPRSPCSQPRCTNMATRKGRCDEHARAKDGRRRQRQGSRPYDRRLWRNKIRPMQLRRAPLCEFCTDDGIVKEATDVDHIDGDPFNNAEDNLRSLCHACHSARTMRDQVQGRAM